MESGLLKYYKFLIDNIFLQLLIHNTQFNVWQLSAQETWTWTSAQRITKSNGKSRQIAGFFKLSGNFAELCRLTGSSDAREES